MNALEALEARRSALRTQDSALRTQRSALSADVIAALATPAGEGAIGVLRLGGPGCVRIASAFLAWKAPPAPRVATLCEARADGALLDRVVAVFFKGPRSYTGEDLLEVHAHGSPFVLARLLEEALRAGARAAEPGEFTRRAFLNGRLDLAQAEAVCQLIRARTRRAHRAAVGQLEGGLSRRLGALRESLVGLLAEVSAGLDHPDEDIPVLERARAQARLEAARADLCALLDTCRSGRLAVDGARVAIVGRPNAGKSSLLNSLLGRERAIVAAAPGTTRDTLEELADLDGTQAVLVDTAGLREASGDPVERAGMKRARSALDACDLAVVVLDRSRPLEAEDRRLLSEIEDRLRADERPAIVALNKCDLPGRTTTDELLRLLAAAGKSSTAAVPAAITEAGASAGGRFELVEVSALRGDGMRALAEAIGRAVAAGAPGQEDGAVVTSLRHRRALEEAREALSRALEADEDEIVALHLREALHAIGSVLGETTPDDVLRAVFSRFCVGK